MQISTIYIIVLVYIFNFIVIKIQLFFNYIMINIFNILWSFLNNLVINIYLNSDPFIASH